MNIKNTIIEHYKKFFDLHAKGIALDEDDHLNIDWAEDLVKKCFIPNVVGSALLSDLMKEQQEIVSNPIRFNGVHIEKIKQVFEKNGIKYDLGF